MSPPGEARRGIEAMLEATSVALVGASARSGSLGERCLIELERSSPAPEIHLVNPRYAASGIGGRPCLSSIEEIGPPVDLVVLGVGDAAIEPELTKAARRGDKSALVFSSAVDEKDPANSGELRRRLGAIASGAEMALCGGGCMGFVNQQSGLRAIGYLERHPLARGPVALVTHSGSAFSALLRADRAIGWSLAVSSGQELVTTTAEYLEYALSMEETKVVALLLETMRDSERLRAGLSSAAERDVPVVALTVGASRAGRQMVAAHSGALAGSDGAWEALFRACEVIRVEDLGELLDTLELLVAGRRAPSRPTGSRENGIAAVLDSGAERALLVDVAESQSVRFAGISSETRARLGELLDPGLEPANPLDVWGRGASPEELLSQCLVTLAEDDSVDAVALAVDLVEELDGDESYRTAVIDAAERTDLPICVISNVPSAIDREAARRLRASKVPVLEGTRSGLRALSHLVELRDAHERRQDTKEPLVTDEARRSKWTERLSRPAPMGSLESFWLLEDYGIAMPKMFLVSDAAAACQASEKIGWPVVLKTAEASLAHKTEAGGVVLGLSSSYELARAYEEMASRLGRDVLVCEMAPPGVELSLGLLTDPLLGPLVVVGSGGLLVELIGDRAVALPPLDEGQARELICSLKACRLLDGYRGSAPADIDSAARALSAIGQLALELGAALRGLEVNPLRVSPSGAVALDVLVEPR